ncbi:MAG: hypothetical protein WCZ98_06495 [Sideroxydans sp.]
MKKGIVAIVMLSSVFLAGTAMAQEGKMEASIAGNMEMKSTDYGAGASDSTSTFMYLRLGQYLSPQLVVSGNVAMFGSSSGGGTTSSVGSTFGIGAKYYLDGAAKSAFVPFVELDVHAVVASTTAGNIVNTMTGAGISGGVGGSYFITEDVSADMSVQLFSDGLSDDYGSEITQSGMRMLFGLTARY